MLNKARYILLAILIAASSLSYAFARYNDFEITKNLELFVEMVRLLDELYVDEIEPDKLIRTGIDSMLASLDPYTSYISEKEMENYRLQTTGKYGGIGALIRTQDDYVIISEPYEGFPAFKAGLMAGDKIVKIGDESAKGMNTEDVSKRLKGKPGTSIDVEIERFGEEEKITKTLVREEIKINSVPYYSMLNDKTGYIRLGSFTENCSKELATALNKLKKENNAKSLILDLRGNPGGLLNEAINVSNVFLDKNTKIVSTKSKKRDWEKNYRTKRPAVDTTIPLAVLIDRGSASASEIVSGVMQDLDRGIVLGNRSFGKGLVQTTKDVGYGSKLKLTTAKYYLPTGRCIQAIDYSGGYKDGAEKIPDSLRTAFSSPKGRTFYDAGGIDPDIEMEDELYGNITASLIGKQLIFGYANQYHNLHNEIPQPETFELTNADFKEFVQFLSDKEYDYTTQSEKILKELKENAEKEKYLDAIAGDIEKLEKQIKHDKEKDLYKFQDEIENLLEQEIVSRYYYQKGRIAERLEEDVTVKKALDILGNISEYNKLLN